MGNPLVLEISNAEATVDELVLSNNAAVFNEFLNSDKELLAALDSKTWDQLTHHEKKYIYRANNYYYTEGLVPVP